ncbi:MAG TPA: hypothetical protein VME19_17510 [Streptosporangiaceae bacterium]|nr:hypothetical protein [Streptosporangiaceae bacterium]
MLRQQRVWSARRTSVAGAVIVAVTAAAAELETALREGYAERAHEHLCPAQAGC